jgi:exodeoxyribonuclease VII large subunit
VPVISAIGHERDETLVDDIAAVACSTPTHAAEAAVPLDCEAARRSLERSVAALRRGGERAAGAPGVDTAAHRHAARLSRAAAASLERRRVTLRQVGAMLRAHDPERTLERGFALAETVTGEAVTSAAAATAAGRVRLRFADGEVGASIDEAERDR